ncbi:MAG TPA: hypothetical protein VJL58_04260, partial [Pyrinomonadaceae bacterium]|nr:hypothetical protein [Pyrinomonadaceae bacterium]
NVTISEPFSGDRDELRTVEIRIELLGAYHDGKILLRYPKVFGYELNARMLDEGHRDWRYDEFRVNDDGQLVHEIEWWGLYNTAIWQIVASDVEYKWIPVESGTPPTNKPGR